MFSNNPSNNQPISADSSIPKLLETGNNRKAIAINETPPVGSDDFPDTIWDIPTWQPPETKIVPSQNTNEEDAEYVNEAIKNQTLICFEQLKYFLLAIGKGKRTYIRCLAPKNVPPDELIRLGLGYQRRDKKTKELKFKKNGEKDVASIIISGYIEWNEDEQEFTFYEKSYNSKIYKHEIVENPWGFQRLKEINKEGFGIYFVVGDGGETDQKITRIPVLYFEDDKNSIDKQWENIKKIQEDNDLIPVACVQTKKSLHTYYRRKEYDEDLQVETFSFLQKKIIQLADSDPSIHNEARLMRLSGFDHVSYKDGNLVFIPCELKLCNLNAPEYSDLDFNGKLPKYDFERWGKNQKKHNFLDGYNVKSFSQTVIEGSTIPHSYSIKNFTPYLEAGEVRANGVETYKCANHNGESNNSLHVFPNGAFYCHYGCDPKDIWREAKNIAVANGYILPPFKNDSPATPEEQGLRETQQQAWKEQREKEHKERYLKSKILTPTITTSTKYFQYLVRELPTQLPLWGDPPPTKYIVSIPDENLILLGCGDLGGGKTTWMKGMIEAIREACPNERWFAFGYINGLLLQQCKGWRKDGIGARRFKHLQSEHAFKDIHKETQDLAFCIHSLKRFEDCLSVFDGCNIVIDEVVSVVKALLQDDNIKEGDRDIILRVFSEALRRAKRVFCFDALLSDMTAWYLSQICPEKKIISVKNEYKRPKPKIEFLLGTAELEKQLSSVENIKKSDNSPICKALLNSKTSVLVSDNRTIIQIIGELLKGQGKEVLVICRDTNGEENVKKFLECPDTWIKENWIDKNIDGCVLISPTGGSGIDISVKNYFTDLYGLFFGVIDVDGILQMLGRLRDNKANFHVWVKDRGSMQNVLGNFSKEIRRNVRDYIDHLQTIIWEGYEGNPVIDIITKFSNQLLEKANDIHFKMQCALMAAQLYEEWHLRECVQETLISRGYELKFVTLESAEDSKKAIKDKRAEFYKQQSDNIFNAQDLTEEEINEISSNFFQTPEQKNALKKFSLRTRLPGIEKTDLWNPEFIQKVTFDNPLYLSQVEMLYLLRNPEVAKLKAQTRWAAALGRESLRHFDMLEERYARVKALQNINIEYFINPNKSWDNDSPELIAAAKEAKKPHNKVALPKAPGKDLVRWINNVLVSLTYAPHSERIHSNQRKYKIILKEEEEKTKHTILECLGKQEKYKDLAQKQKSHILGSKIAQNPCPEPTKSGSTCGKFDFNKTSGKWSHFSLEKNQETDPISHVEEQVSGFRTWAGDTEVAATG